MHSNFCIRFFIVNEVYIWFKTFSSNTCYESNTFRNAGTFFLANPIYIQAIAQHSNISAHIMEMGRYFMRVFLQYYWKSLLKSYWNKITAVGCVLWPFLWIQSNRFSFPSAFTITSSSTATFETATSTLLALFPPVQFNHTWLRSIRGISRARFFAVAVIFVDKFWEKSFVLLLISWKYELNVSIILYILFRLNALKLYEFSL